ncbi:MAG: type III-B CRISPR module RAMP protein Cmr6 [Gammaproteobacteria bacterium]
MNKEDLRREGRTHAGLLLSRYLRVQRTKGEDQHHVKDRVELFNAAIKATRAAKEIYQCAFERRKRELREFGKVRAVETGEFRVQGRLIVGLGGENVLETGITLHHTYGVPIIPGSALKGLASHYCDQVWGAVDEEFKITGARDHDENGKEYLRQVKYHRTLFGANDDSGYIIFHDAWITPESLEEKKPNNEGLVLDVMTPHHVEYYSGDTKNDQSIAPSDFDSPNPITFLSVAGTFHVAVSCDDESDNGKTCATRAMELLTEALKHWGVGGKTNAGYGRMGPSALGEMSVPTKSKPRYQVRDQIIAKRIEDPKGKGRMWFQADDGFGGRITQGAEPSVEMGATVALWVAAVSNGYNFSSKPLASSTHTKKRR